MKNKKKISCIILGSILAITVATSCNDRSSVQTVIDQYKAGEISEDSVLTYLSDSINLKPVLEWAEKNKSDDIFASYVLGRAYKFGLGVDRNPQKSKAYYIAAAKSGNTNAMQGLAHLYAGYPGYENMDSAQFWYTKSAELGIGSSYFHLSQLEIHKKAMQMHPVDTLLLIEYYKKGFQLNDPLCLTELARAYYMGFGVEVNKSKAFNMLSLFDKNKLTPDGLTMLGEMYELGEVTQQNFNAAIKYYRNAADKGHTGAICKLGNFYQFGQGVEQNDSLAFIQYQKAANGGNAWGQRCVAICYHNGIGTKQDIGNARNWYITAAKNGDEEAIKFCIKNELEY